MIAALLFALHPMAQTVNAISAPNWLVLTEVDTRKMSSFSRLGEFAALGEARQAAATMCAERRLLNGGLEYFYAGLILPFSGAGIGVSVNHFGFDAMKQSRLGIAYGKTISSAFSLGIQFNYHRISVSGYGSAGAVTAAICMRLKAGPQTLFSCIADNPFGGNLGKTGEKIASRFAIGISHSVSEKVTVSFRVSREQGSVPDFNLLVNYAIHSRIGFDGGFSLNKATAFIGSSITLKNVRLRQVVSWTQTFGVGPAIILEFKKSDDE